MTRFKIEVRKLSFEDNLLGLQYQIYIVANKILYQNQSLFLEFEFENGIF